MRNKTYAIYKTYAILYSYRKKVTDLTESIQQ